MLDKIIYLENRVPIAQQATIPQGSQAMGYSRCLNNHLCPPCPNRAIVANTSQRPQNDIGHQQVGLGQLQVCRYRSSLKPLYNWPSRYSDMVDDDPGEGPSSANQIRNLGVLKACSACAPLQARLLSINHGLLWSIVANNASEAPMVP